MSDDLKARLRYEALESDGNQDGTHDYEVTISRMVTQKAVVTVEASSFEDAKLRARKQANQSGLFYDDEVHMTSFQCHQLPNKTDGE